MSFIIPATATKLKNEAIQKVAVPDVILEQISDAIRAAAKEGKTRYHYKFLRTDAPYAMAIQQYIARLGYGTDIFQDGVDDFHLTVVWE